MRARIMLPRNPTLRHFILLPLAALVGCASLAVSLLIEGGHAADGSEKNRIVAKYKAKNCVEILTNAAVPHDAGDDYWLLREKSGFALAEMVDRASQGVVVTNAWRDGDSTHFFAWSRTRRYGQEYILPLDHARPGVRLMYGPLMTEVRGTVTRPTSEPVARCDLLPVG